MAFFIYLLKTIYRRRRLNIFNIGKSNNELQPNRRHKIHLPPEAEYNDALEIVRLLRV
jgi:hypothetical protein